MKEIDVFIERQNINNIFSKIPRNLIQTYENNKLNNTIYDNIISILKINNDFNYYLITDEIGINLINKYFDKYTLDAFNKLNIGAAKGDFLRYISMYIYGGVYLDLDSSINISLSSYIDPNIEHIFFLDWDNNLQQWCFMCSPNNPIILSIIKEMVKRIYNEEKNIFIATGPTLFTDVIYNYINNTNIYNTKLLIPSSYRYYFFMSNKNFMNGIILYENDINNFYKNFQFKFNGFNDNMLYNNNKYIVTYNEPTPNFYK